MKKSKMIKKDIELRPWIKNYQYARANLEYPNNSISDVIMETARKYPEYYAYEYFGNKVTYRNFVKEIENAAKALKNYGVSKDDKVCICMPNTPEGVIMVYATNLIGAIATMIHPMSGEKEIENYINQADAKFILVIDVALEKIINIKRNTKLQKILVASAGESLPYVKKTLYKIGNMRKFTIPKDDDDIVLWSTFISSAKNFVGVCHEPRNAYDPAVILYSGGTTGKPKAILLSNLNFNALAYQAKEMIREVVPGNSVLSILPIFHGFGLAVCIHTPLTFGMKCTLIPQFKVKEFGDLIRRYKPNFIVGVPTLFEALLKQKLKANELECVEAVISGGDFLTENQKKAIDKFLQEHGSKAKVRPGYGLTEATGATCLSPTDDYKEGSIGYPLPDMYFKIVENDTHKEVPFGQDGEICISGPTVMLKYLNDPVETNQALRFHEDGKVWLHTGDVGCMDKNGLIYFKQRLKRIIISSGYNIYPSHIENVIMSHPKVSACTVIGIPHPYKGQVAKAFIVLEDGVDVNSDIKKEIQELCNKNISYYAIPQEYEYKEKLPTTLVGKVAFKKLEEEENEKRKKKEK